MAVSRTLLGRALGARNASLSAAYTYERRVRYLRPTGDRELSFLVTGLRHRPRASSVTDYQIPSPFVCQLIPRCSYSNDADKKTSQADDVQTDELVAIIRSGRVRLVDVREPGELAETGIIHDAINIPVGEVSAAFSLSPEDFQKKYGAPKPSIDDEDILFYCKAGIRSRTAMETVRQLGYARARHYVNGWLGWEEHLQKEK